MTRLHGQPVYRVLFAAGAEPPRWDPAQPYTAVEFVPWLVEPMERVTRDYAGLAEHFHQAAQGLWRVVPLLTDSGWEGAAPQFWLRYLEQLREFLAAVGEVCEGGQACARTCHQELQVAWSEAQKAAEICNEAQAAMARLRGPAEAVAYGAIESQRELEIWQQMVRGLEQGREAGSQAEHAIEACNHELDQAGARLQILVEPDPVPVLYADPLRPLPMLRELSLQQPPRHPSPIAAETLAAVRGPAGEGAESDRADGLHRLAQLAPEDTAYVLANLDPEQVEALGELDPEQDPQAYHALAMDLPHQLLLRLGDEEAGAASEA